MSRIIVQKNLFLNLAAHGFKLLYLLSNRTGEKKINNYVNGP